VERFLKRFSCQTIHRKLFHSNQSHWWAFLEENWIHFIGNSSRIFLSSLVLNWWWTGLDASIFLQQPKKCVWLEFEWDIAVDSCKLQQKVLWSLTLVQYTLRIIFLHKSCPLSISPPMINQELSCFQVYSSGISPCIWWIWSSHLRFSYPSKEESLKLICSFPLFESFVDS